MSRLFLIECIPAMAYRFVVKVIIQLTPDQEAKALPILLRHSPGMVLPRRTYVLSDNALRALRRAGIGFSELSREATAPTLEEAAGERV
jgi:hypothetical protein